MKFIFIGSDHGGFELKSEICRFLSSVPDVTIIEAGGATSPTDACDYPEVAGKVCEAVLAKSSDLGLIDETGLLFDSNLSKDAALGILVCGSGIGMSIAANKIQNISCALVHDHYTAKMARRHNDANVLALGGRVVGSEVAKDAVLGFLSEVFEGGRHSRRVSSIRMSMLQK